MLQTLPFAALLLSVAAFPAQPEDWQAVSVREGRAVFLVDLHSISGDQHGTRSGIVLTVFSEASEAVPGQAALRTRYFVDCTAPRIRMGPSTTYTLAGKTIVADNQTDDWEAVEAGGSFERVADAICGRTEKFERAFGPGLPIREVRAFLKAL